MRKKIWLLEKFYRTNIFSYLVVPAADRCLVWARTNSLCIRSFLNSFHLLYGCMCSAITVQYNAPSVCLIQTILQRFKFIQSFVKFYKFSNSTFFGMYPNKYSHFQTNSSYYDDNLFLLYFIKMIRRILKLV